MASATACKVERCFETVGERGVDAAEVELENRTLGDCAAEKLLVAEINSIVRGVSEEKLSVTGVEAADGGLSCLAMENDGADGSYFEMR